MTTPLSPELRRVYASAPAERRWVETLVLSHPLFVTTYQITRDPYQWRFTVDGALMTFVPVPFTVKLPTTDGKGQQDLDIVMDNVGREAMDAIEAASYDPTINIGCTFRVFLDIPDSPTQFELSLAIQSIIIDQATIHATATRADTLNRPFPTELYRVDLFPGLDR